MPDDLKAALTAAAIAPLNDRAFLRITGGDATRWLNGMVTNSIQALAPGQGSYNFLLNAQGRIQGDAWIYREPQDGEPAFLLETSTAQADIIQAILDRYIIMDDVELAPHQPGEDSFAILGPQAATTLSNLGLPAPEPASLVEAQTPEGRVLLLTRGEGLIELHAARPVIERLRNSAVALGLPVLTAEAVEQIRILQGTPDFGRDIRDTYLPQETAQTHALHFNKGCYLGQEIVERIRSRGQVHRTFTKFELSGELPAELPAPLDSGGKAVGEITSAAEVDGRLLALGYARREALETGRPLTYAGGTATRRE